MKRYFTRIWSLRYVHSFYSCFFQLKDRDRQVLKDKFHVIFKIHSSSQLKIKFFNSFFCFIKGFNKEFDEIREVQTKYIIPTPELADQLREENNSYIVTKYKKFYDSYARLNFATNRDKYIKYTPEELSLKLKDFFASYWEWGSQEWELGIIMLSFLPRFRPDIKLVSCKYRLFRGLIIMNEMIYTLNTYLTVYLLNLS